MTWSVLYNITCVDVGATQGQSRYIQQLKRDMYKKKNDCTKNKINSHILRAGICFRLVNGILILFV